ADAARADGRADGPGGEGARLPYPGRGRRRCHGRGPRTPAAARASGRREAGRRGRKRKGNEGRAKEGAEGPRGDASRPPAQGAPARSGFALRQACRTSAEMNERDSVRIDKWLWYARFFKTRGLAARLCASARVRIDG